MATSIKRTIMERFDVPGSNYETIMMLVELPPQINTGLHTHPGFDAAYLLEGDLTVIALGQPDKTIKAGESWHVPPGIVHEVKAGNTTVKVLAAYVVEKGKPLATPYNRSSTEGTLSSYCPGVQAARGQPLAGEPSLAPHAGRFGSDAIRSFAQDGDGIQVR